MQSGENPLAAIERTSKAATDIVEALVSLQRLLTQPRPPAPASPHIRSWLEPSAHELNRQAQRARSVKAQPERDARVIASEIGSLRAEAVHLPGDLQEGVRALCQALTAAQRHAFAVAAAGAVADELWRAVQDAEGALEAWHALISEWRARQPSTPPHPPTGASTYVFNSGTMGHVAGRDAHGHVTLTVGDLLQHVAQTIDNSSTHTAAQKKEAKSFLERLAPFAPLAVEGMKHAQEIGKLVGL